MVRILLLTLILFRFALAVSTAQVRGKVTGSTGHPLPYASVYLKGTTSGTNANSEGVYSLDLAPGNYVVVCEYLGFQASERPVKGGPTPVELNFTLFPQRYTMRAIEVRSQGEDPAYSIIRHAIRMRDYYYNQVHAFVCKDYIKTLFRLRNAPVRFLGQPVEMEGLDSNRRGIVFLSESLTRLSVRRPKDYRMEVLSARESGDKSSYGFDIPALTSFYQNHINLGGRLNPRGFISPIAQDAFHYYRYRLEGKFFIEGRLINRILVIPRRKFEPLFSGYIEIMDSSWRIRGLDLQLTKSYGLQLADTLDISQLYIPADSGVWMVKTELLRMDINLLGFEVYGDLDNVYSDYNLHPQFSPGFFGKVIMAIDSGANRKSTAYWDTLRPVPLSGEEKRDYVRKDSLEQLHQSARYVDSIQKKQKRVRPLNLILTGISVPIKPLHLTLNADPLIREVQFNTVEGLVLEQDFHLRRYFFGKVDSTDQGGPRDEGHFVYNPYIRYGFSNHHFNGGVGIEYHFGVHTWDYEKSVLSISGGKQVFQFDRTEPISPILNTIYSLFDRENFEKIYEAWYFQVNYKHRWDNGLLLTASVQYQDRRALANTTNYSWSKSSSPYTLNQPSAPLDTPFAPGKATTLQLQLFYQPGQRFIRYPDHLQAIGSGLPEIGIGYSRGIPGLAGSEVNFDRYKIGIHQEIGMGLLGRLDYTFSMGGFLNSQHTELPDLQYFNGNQTLLALPYLSGFQLAPYYVYSNAAPFYLSLHGEYHFNGLLTNKIPLFRRLNWWLVGAANGFYINPRDSYLELSAGLENILKFVRVDFIAAYRGKEQTRLGIRIGASVLGRSGSREKFESDF
ncbi:MAG TPA: DUF5686 and carboxypeptidase regulatory-like domain-containing protein [Chitinophagaceae bacterium]|nr:DUF5686 and carboxypeptidase regulatory-like domain-containing protein [Chitinophagaceae bacterium]